MTNIRDLLEQASRRGDARDANAFLARVNRALTEEDDEFPSSPRPRRRMVLATAAAALLAVVGTSVALGSRSEGRARQQLSVGGTTTPATGSSSTKATQGISAAPGTAL